MPKAYRIPPSDSATPTGHHRQPPHYRLVYLLSGLGGQSLGGRAATLASGTVVAVLGVQKCAMAASPLVCVLCHKGLQGACDILNLQQ